MAFYSDYRKQTSTPSSSPIGGANLPIPSFNPMDMRTSAVNKPNLIQLIQKSYSLKQLREAEYSAYELAPYFPINDLIEAGFTEGEISTAYVIFESISKHAQDLQKEFFEKYCLVRGIERPEEEKLLLFEDEMAKLDA